jgi:ribosome maturation factor RimP
MTDTPLVKRVRVLIAPIASDLDLDVYDIEQRGGTLRVTLDTRPGSPAGVDLHQLALATRLIGRELDHSDPVPGKYTLEVTSPGVERTLRLPAHFRREIGKSITVRLADVTAEQRRIEGVLVAADDRTATIRVAHGADITDQVVEIAGIDRARTVFEWGPEPKPGKTNKAAAGARTSAAAVSKKAGAKRSAKPAAKRALASSGAEEQPSRSMPDSLKEPS